MKISRSKIIGLIFTSLIILGVVFPVTTHAASGFDACFPIKNGVPIPDIMCLLGKFLHTFIWKTFGELVFQGAMFLQRSLEFTMKFSSFISDISGIRVAWSVFRDTMNISFIFILLYAAIRMILGLGKHETIIKGVITAGLLINFSFFFTAVIIDVSNVVVVELNRAIVAIGAGGEVFNPGDIEGQAEGISSVFMQGLGIRTEAYDSSGILHETYETHVIQQMVFSSITFLIVAFVFFTMGFFLQLRFLILILLLITSPIAVMGGFFPQLSAQSKKWWDTLIGQALFAPIMMLFLTVTAVIISSEGFANTFVLSDKAMTNPFPFGDGLAGMIQYIFVIGLLVTSVIVGKQTAGGAAKGLTSWATKTAGKASFGLAARGLQGSVGWAGNKLGNSAVLSDTAVNSKSALARGLAGGLLRTGSYVGSRTFDVRNTPLSNLIGAGKGIKNREDRIKADAKAREERQTRYAENAARLPGSRQSPGEIALERELSNLDVRNNELAEKLKEVEKRKAEAVLPQSKVMADKEIAEIKRQMEDERKKTEARRAEITKEIAEARKNRPEMGMIEKLLAPDEVKDARSELVKATKALTAAQIGEVREINKRAAEIKDDRERTAFLQDNLNAEQQKYLDAFARLQKAGDEVDARKKAELDYISGRDVNSFFPSKQAAADSIRKKQGRNKDQRLADDIIEALKAKDKPEEKPDKSEE